MTTAFQVILEGTQEFPTNASTASGLGTLIFDDVTTSLSYDLTVAGLDFGDFFDGGADETAATADNVADMHIHQGARGVNGAVRFAFKPHDADDLATIENADDTRTITGNWETTDPSAQPITNFAAELGAAVPGSDVGFYVNIHTVAFPGGEIRGQLVAIADDFANTIVGTNGNDFLPGLDGDDTITGGLGNDRIDGGIGADTANVNASTDGADTANLGGGLDTVNVTSNTVGANEVRLTFTSAEVGNGNANDSNTLANQDGGLAVRMQTEDGSGALTGPVSRYDDEGITFVASSPDLTFDVRDLVSGAQRGNLFRTVTLGTNGVDSFTTTAEADYVNAGQGGDTVHGGGGSDFLVGGGGEDFLFGEADNDFYIGGLGNDTIIGGDIDIGVDTIAAFNVTTDGADTVDLGGGIDIFNVSATAATNVRITFTSAEIGNGNALDGNNNTNEDGGLAVRLQAETAGVPAGNVTRVEDEGMIFIGGAGVTFDVRDLPSGVGRGELFEVVALGTNGDDTLTAVQVARPYYFNGGMGADTITGGSAADFLVGGAGGDTLNGGIGNDSFLGGGGTDTLVGGTGLDTMTGGADSDRYFVDNAGDTVVEGAAEGTQDRVLTAISYTLGAAAEVELFTTTNAAGTGALNLTGNSFAQTIAGNAGNNIIDGKGGADNMQGFAGNDWYYVDSTADVVLDGVGQGADRVFASASFVLTAGAEIEILSTNNGAGTAAINLTGNGFGQSIGGNAGDNVINGGGGNDSMVGFGGNDRYFVDSTGDSVVEQVGGGNDRVSTSISYTLTSGQEIELFTTTNGAGFDSIDLTGNNLAQSIGGNAGANVLNGGLGNDTLTGFGGLDTFFFNTALGATNIDLIADFNVADDTIRLENAIFAGLANGALAADAFNTGAAATEADDRIIYNAATGALIFDADGLNGNAGIQFATLNAGLGLTSADFAVV